MIACALLALMSGVVIQAQAVSFTPSQQTWFWSWRDSGAEFTAFNADGVVQVLPVDQPIRFVSEAVRVDDSTSLVIAGNDTAASVFELTESHARALYSAAVTVDPDGDPRLLPNLSVWAASYPRLLLAAFGETLLYNADTGDLTRVDMPDLDAAQFIAGGIRYSAAAEAEAGVYNFNLSTGDITPLFTFAPSADYLSRYCAPIGSVWVCEHAPADAPLMITRVLVMADGSAEIVPDNADIAEGFDGSTYLVTYSVLDEGRELSIQPLGSEIVTTFSLPPEIAITPTDPLHAVRVIDRARLLITHDSGFNILAEDGTTTRLGNYFCCGAFDTIRPPWYALFLEGETVLWNVIAGEIVMRAPYSIVPGRSGFIEGAFLAGGYEGETTAYSVSDLAAVSLPSQDSGQYLATLPGGVFLYTSSMPWQDDPGDILRWMANDGYTLLIREARPVMMRAATLFRRGN
jgi:hypothetical protein